MLTISITSLLQIFWKTFSTRYKWRHCFTKCYLEYMHFPFHSKLLFGRPTNWQIMDY